MDILKCMLFCGRRWLPSVGITINPNLGHRVNHVSFAEPVQHSSVIRHRAAALPVPMRKPHCIALQAPFAYALSSMPHRCFDRRTPIVPSVYAWRYAGFETLSASFCSDLNALIVLNACAWRCVGGKAHGGVFQPPRRLSGSQRILCETTRRCDFRAASRGQNPALGCVAQPCAAAAAAEHGERSGQRE